MDYGRFVLESQSASLFDVTNNASAYVSRHMSSLVANGDSMSPCNSGIVLNAKGAAAAAAATSSSSSYLGECVFFIASSDADLVADEATPHYLANNLDETEEILNLNECVVSRIGNEGYNGLVMLKTDNGLMIDAPSQGFIDLNSPELCTYAEFDNESLNVASSLLPSPPTSVSSYESISPASLSSSYSYEWSIKMESTTNLNGLLDVEDKFESMSVNSQLRCSNSALVELKPWDVDSVLDMPSSPPTTPSSVSSPSPCDTFSDYSSFAAGSPLEQKPVHLLMPSTPQVKCEPITNTLANQQSEPSSSPSATPLSMVKSQPCSPRSPSLPSSPESVSSITSEVKPKRYPNTKDCLHVAEFLLMLLTNEATCGEERDKLVKWENVNKGIFRIMKPNDLSNLWAKTKSNKEKMNFANMARGIRYARVKSGDFDLVNKKDNVGKKLVFRFSQRFRLRNPWLIQHMDP